MNCTYKNILCMESYLMPNKGDQWRNLLVSDNWVLPGSPEPTMVGFCNLVGVGIGPVSKKLAVKWRHYNIKNKMPIKS